RRKREHRIQRVARSIITVAGAVMNTKVTANVIMPLGFDPANNFSAFVNAFHVMTAYGLSAPTSSQAEPLLSETLDLRVSAADPAPLLYASFNGSLLYVPGTGTKPGKLRLQPLPFDALALSKKMPGSGFPSAFIYDNVLPSSVVAM